MLKLKIEQLWECVEKNIMKVYLILANLVLVIFAIWFSNVGILPFAKAGDFAFFAILALILALYRPSWTFAFFIGTLAVENVNLMPKNIGLALRPYQLFGFVTIVALLVQIVSKRLIFALPKWRWYDGLPLLFAIGGFASSLNAFNRGASFKQAVVALSFVALYFLSRVYIQSKKDLTQLAPFFLSSALVVVIYGIWQNVRFLHGANPFEVMPGRPNATFTEPDWLGIWLVFLLAVMFAIIYANSKKTRISILHPSAGGSISKQFQISNFKFQIFNQFPITQLLNYALLVLIFLVLILTVSRSAWVGALLVTIGFLKIMLTNGSFKLASWSWKKFTEQASSIFICLIVAVGLIYVFGLTRFQVANRAASTGGLQKITIACPVNVNYTVPTKINNFTDLGPCRHINLEDIKKEQAIGNKILEVYREDPSLNIRAQIYQKSLATIKAHPILGIGWGSISHILGTDERGAGLNASNIFLETYLGTGLVGILSFVILLGYIFVEATKQFLSSKYPDRTVVAFVLLGWAAIVIPNLFNSGIFLGFVWVYLAIAVSLLQNIKK